VEKTKACRGEKLTKPNQKKPRSKQNKENKSKKTAEWVIGTSSIPDQGYYLLPNCVKWNIHSWIVSSMRILVILGNGIFFHYPHS